MGKGSSKQTAPPKPAPIATPSEADTAGVKRSTQMDEAKRRKRQQTVYGGSDMNKGSGVASTNVLG